MTPTPKQKKLFAVITSRCNLKVCFVKISKAFGQSLFFAGEKLLNNEDNTYRTFSVCLMVSHQFEHCWRHFYDQ